MLKISSLFLFAVLVLGMGSYPTIYSNDTSTNLLSVPNVFAQSNSEESDTNEEDDTKEDDEDEIEIEIETEDGNTKVKVEMNDEETELEFEGFPEDEIITAIIDLTGLTEDEIRDIWKVEQEDDTKEDDSEKSKSEKLLDRQSRLEEKRQERLEKHEQKLAEREAKLAEREQRALERAQLLVEKLESRILQLEDRLQNLVEKLETGEYYGNISDKVTEPKSFTLTFNGTASQIGNSTNQLPLEATISLTSQVIKDNAKKLKIDGGEIWIGDQIYDVVFGKARSSSSGPGGEKDSLVVIAQTSKDTEEIQTMRLSIELSSPIDPQSNESLELSVSSKSKIASDWFLSGEGKLSG